MALPAQYPRQAKRPTMCLPHSTTAARPYHTTTITITQTLSHHTHTAAVQTPTSQTEPTSTLHQA
ncbi:hypothetical protein CGCSCA5_v008832 [Colletotrichum siamense]|nr:hypothetical protein CGCSCA5_v008832 [Colletotrichum siamense]